MNSTQENIIYVLLDEEDDENCLEKIVKLCNDKLDVEASKSEFDHAHRVGPKRSATKRPIIVKFKSYDSKMEINKKKNALKGTPIFINEDLLKFNAKLFTFARKNSCGAKSVWASNGNGKILVRSI